MNKSINNQKQEAKYEKMIISRLRTNVVEFASIVRGSVGDSNAGGTTSQSKTFFLNYPSYYRNSSGTIAQLTNICGLLADEQKVFDEYKVVRLQIKYLPWVTGQVRVDSAVAFTAPSDSALIMTIDADDGANFTSLANALNSQNPAVYQRYSTTVRKITMLQTDEDMKMKWLNLTAIIPNSTTPPDPNNPAKLASVKTYTGGYQLANTTEATFYVEWEVLFKGSYTLA